MSHSECREDSFCGDCVREDKETLIANLKAMTSGADTLREEVNRLNLQNGELKAEIEKVQKETLIAWNNWGKDLEAANRLISAMRPVVDAADLLWRSDKGDTEAEAYLWREVEKYIVWQNELEEKLTEKRIDPVCFLCGAKAVGKIGAEPRCEAHV